MQLMANELTRLRAVERFKNLDEAIVKDLNEIVNLASDICGAPIALTTLLDSEKQWFTAKKGIELDCTDRNVAICNYTIQTDGLMVVADTTTDDRFASNPLVTGEPYIRFYAGATLVTKDGFAIGTLCVVDFIPRYLTAHQKNSLVVLARQAMNLMELHWSLQTLETQHQDSMFQKVVLEESEVKLNAISNSTRDMHLLLNDGMHLLAFNRAASVHFKTVNNKKLAAGDHMPQYLDPSIQRSFLKYFDIAFSGRTIRRQWQMWAGTRHSAWHETTFMPVRHNNGNIVGVAVNSADITDKKLQEERIRVQNEALTRIAIIQSHELRRPVASLLGLIDIFKMEQTAETQSDYFDMLEMTVNELDQKIKGIVRESEDTIKTGHLKIVA